MVSGFITRQLGRFLSVDPLRDKYPELSPYQFANNSPISGVDLDGKEYQLSIYDPNVTEDFLSVWNDGDVFTSWINFEISIWPIVRDMLKTVFKIE
jgi:hypothetical protein